MDILQNRGTLLLLSLVLSLGTVGCTDEKKAETSASGQVEVVATVNGEPITREELDEYRNARPDAARMQDTQALLDELVTQKAIYQDALRQNLDKDPVVIRELAQLRTRVLASAAVRKAINDNPITDEALSAEYDKLKERMVAPEYKASHILVKEEEQAKKLIEQLNQGADFAKLAQEHSTDSSGKDGGDLGWFNPQQMVPPFSLAVSQLEKGAYTKEPVQTQFGWHIIKLEDSRQSEPPALEEIKGQLEQMLKQRQVSEYIQKVKDAADVSIKGETDGSNGEKSDAPAMENSVPATEEKSDDSTVEEGGSTDEEKADTSETK